MIKTIAKQRPHAFQRDYDQDFRVCPRGLLRLNDPVQWGRVRRVTAPALAGPAVYSMLPDIAQVCCWVRFIAAEAEEWCI